MQISGIMTGLGIVGLAGIVVKNGILVIEFTDELRASGMKTREAAIEAGKTRIIPVLLTAMAAILALIPLAVGFNINFITLFSESQSPYLLRWGQCRVLETLVLDDHLRPGFCLLYDPVHGAEYVSDCGTAEKADASVLGWEMGFLPRNSALYHSFHPAGFYQHDPSRFRSRRQEKKGEAAEPAGR